MMTFAEFLIELQMRLASSNIQSIRYSEKEERLDVTFRSGSVYRYENVPDDVVDELKFAESKGRYFHQHIRGNPEYPYLKLRGPRPGYKSSMAFNTAKTSVSQRHRLNTTAKAPWQGNED